MSTTEKDLRIKDLKARLQLAQDELSFRIKEVERLELERQESKRMVRILESISNFNDEEEAEVRRQCLRAGFNDLQTNGDSYHVPRVGGLAEMMADRIIDLVARVQRLEEAGDRILAIAEHKVWADDSEIDKAISEWTKAKEAKP